MFLQNVGKCLMYYGASHPEDTTTNYFHVIDSVDQNTP
jgi:hypothetical protein